MWKRDVTNNHPRLLLQLKEWFSVTAVIYKYRIAPLNDARALLSTFHTLKRTC